MKIIVTGCSGFVGTHLCNTLKEHEIVKVSRTNGVDIRNYEDIRVVMDGVDIVFHLATVWRDTFELFKTNVMGTLNVLEAMKERGVKKMVFFSSMGVYGKPKFLPVTEKHPLVPNHFYGLSKLLGENLCRYYSLNHGISIVTLRCSGIYGEERKDGAVTNFVARALKNEPIVINSDGSEVWDMVYVKDVVDVCLKALEYINHVSKVEIFNIGGREPVNMKQLVNLIVSLTDTKASVIYKNNPTDLKFYYDISRARKLLGYKPRSLKEGLTKYIEWAKNKLP